MYLPVFIANTVLKKKQHQKRYYQHRKVAVDSRSDESSTRLAGHNIGAGRSSHRDDSSSMDISSMNDASTLARGSTTANIGSIHLASTRSAGNATTASVRGSFLDNPSSYRNPNASPSSSPSHFKSLLSLTGLQNGSVSSSNLPLRNSLLNIPEVGHGIPEEAPQEHSTSHVHSTVGQGHAEEHEQNSNHDDVFSSTMSYTSMVNHHPATSRVHHPSGNTPVMRIHNIPTLPLTTGSPSQAINNDGGANTISTTSMLWHTILSFFVAAPSPMPSNQYPAMYMHSDQFSSQADAYPLSPHTPHSSQQQQLHIQQPNISHHITGELTLPDVIEEEQEDV
jgi:hypothetical protein